MNIEPTTQEILVAVNRLSERMDSKFVEVDNKFVDIIEVIHGFAENVQYQFDEIRLEFKSEIGGIKSEIGGIKSEIGGIKSQMVTKEYLDDKMADLRGDLIYIDKKTDNKIDFVVGKLQSKKILNKQESEEIISMSPFPKLNG